MKINYEKIAIVGAGPAGAFLASLLSREEINVDVYEKSRKLGCYCAWGTVESELKGFLRKVGLNIKDYVLSKIKRVIVNGIEVKVSNLITFNKPKLISDLLKGVKVTWAEASREIVGKYDLVVDATGWRRSLLPSLKNDFLMPTIEYVVKTKDLDENTVYIRFGKVGYAWLFPISNNYWHLGAGDTVLDPLFLVKKLVKEIGLKTRILCFCKGIIRLKPPMYSRPIKHGNIVGCGESIGTVFPVTGEGIIPSMKSALMLFNVLANNRSLNEYEHAIVKEFRWLNQLFEIAYSLTGSGLKLVWILVKNYKSIFRYARRLGAASLINIIKALSKLL